ncbi:MAG: hypothetical protein N3G19_02150 [Candidatus Pacearchaeota archaeon]|nr:hypothetical protein [Candidatus Pacearchaeota archaeon]
MDRDNGTKTTHNKENYKSEVGIIKSIIAEHIFNNPNEPKPNELLEDRVTIETILLYPAKRKRKKDEADFEANLIQNLIEKIYRDKEITFTEIKAYDNEGKPYINRFWQNAPDSKYEVEEILLRMVNDDDKDIIREFTEKEKEENYLLFQRLKIVGVPKEIEKVIRRYSLLENAVLYKAPRPYTGKNWESYKLFKEKFNGIYYGTFQVPNKMENVQRPYLTKDTLLKNIRVENLLEIEREEILKFLDKVLKRKYAEEKIEDLIKSDFNKIIRLLLFELRQQIIKDVLRNPELGWSNFDWRAGLDKQNDIRVYDIFNRNDERIYDFTFTLSSNTPIRSWLARKFSYILEAPSKASLFETMSGYGRNIAIRHLFDYFSLLNKPFNMSIPEDTK